MRVARSGPKKEQTTMTSITFTAAATTNLIETGVDWASDWRALKAGETTPEALLEDCLAGADEDRAEGWREYVGTLEALLDVTTADIKRLRDSAGSAGDSKQVEICGRALDGSKSDIAECERVIRDARAESVTL
jgi:hypothetical protein